MNHPDADVRASLQQAIRNIALGDDGVWRPPGNSAVSYPDEGHDSCHGVEDDSFWFAHRNRCIAAMVENFPPPPGLAFADVGGGNHHDLPESSSGADDKQALAKRQGRSL